MHPKNIKGDSDPPTPPGSQAVRVIWGLPWSPSVIKEELKNLGKSLEIAEKISLGKINKFKEDISLLSQDWVMDPKLKVKDVLNKVDLKNLKIKDFIRIKIGE